MRTMQKKIATYINCSAVDIPGGLALWQVGDVDIIGEVRNRITKAPELLIFGEDIRKDFNVLYLERNKS